MLADKENLNSRTSKANEVKKRPSLSSPFSAASPSARPFPKKMVKPLHETGDQNLDATRFVDETFNISDMKLEMNESTALGGATTMSCNIRDFQCDSNIEESLLEQTHLDEDISEMKSSHCEVVHGNREATGVESTVNEVDLTRTVNSKELDGNFNKMITCFGADFKEAKSRSCDVVDGNLLATAVESTIQGVDLTHTLISERMDDIINRTITAVEAEGSEEFIEAKSSSCEVIDGNLEITAMESTIHGVDLTHTLISERMDDIINRTITAVEAEGTEEFNKAKSSSCEVIDGNLEITAMESTIHGVDLTHTLISERMDDIINRTITAVEAEGTEEFNKAKSSSCEVIDGNLETTAMECTTHEVFLTQTMINEGHDIVNRTISAVASEGSEEFNKTKSSFCAVIDGNLEATAMESTVEEADSTITLISEELGDSIDRTITAVGAEFNQDFDKGVNFAKEINELRVGVSHAPDMHISASFNVSLLGEVSMLEVDPSSKSECPSNLASIIAVKSGSKGSKPTNSPITRLSEKDSSSQLSTVYSSAELISDHSPTVSKTRKYNLNDSDISFLMNENRIYDMALREASDSCGKIEQLNKKLVALEEEKTIILEHLRTLSSELKEYKAKFATQESELLEASKRLNDLVKSKEYAEKTVADYEFIVEDLKKRHTKQQEALNSKVYSLEEELENLRASHLSQSELTLTSAGLSTELTIANERLLLAEEAKAAAEYRCEKLTKELQLALFTATSYADEMATVNGNVASLAIKLSTLEEVVKNKELELVAQRDRSTKECLDLEMKLKQAESALTKSEEKVEELLRQAAASEENMALLREAHTTSELDLLKIMDELKEAKAAFEQSEESRVEVSTRCFTVEKELHRVNLKLESVQRVNAAVDELRNECAVLEEQLSAEKLANGVLISEVKQLRQDIEALKQANSALAEAENRATNAAKDLQEHSKCHAEQLSEHITQMNSQIAEYATDKELLEKKLVEQLEKESMLSEEIVNMRVALREAEAEATRLHKVKEDLQGELLLLKQSHENHVAETEKLTATSVELQSQIELLKLERDDLKEQLLVSSERYKESSSAADKMMESLKSEVANALSEVELLKSRLAATEDSKRLLENDFVEVNVALNKCQAELATLAVENTVLEEKLNQQEGDCVAKAMALDEMRVSMVELESTVEMLKSEVRSRNEELVSTNEKLNVEIASNGQIVSAFAALEQEHMELMKEKDAFDLELEKQKNRYVVEVNTAQKIAEELKEEVRKLQSHIVAEEAAAKQKLEEMTKQMHRLELEISNSKASQIERDMQLTQMGFRCQELIAEKQQLEARLSDAIARANRADHKGLEKRSNDCNGEVEELKQELERKSREIDRLGRLCDEFDEIEDKYRQELFSLYKEIDQLKAQLNPSIVPDVPNLETAFTEGIELLTPETPDVQITQNCVRCQALVAEKQQLEARLSDAVASVNQANIGQPEMKSNDRKDELEELKRELERKSREIDRLGKLCDEFDEIEDNYRQELFSLIKERDQLKAQLNPSIVPDVPNLETAFTEGIELLTPETADVQLTKNCVKCQALVVEKQQLEARHSDAVAPIGHADPGQPEMRSNDCNDKIKELEQQLERKSREIDRLGRLCDEFDEIEDNYRRELFSVIRERDQLKAQLNPSIVPDVPNLETAFTEGVNMLTPEKSLVHNVGYTDLKTGEDEGIMAEIEELKRRCTFQQQRISELEKIRDEAGEFEEKMRKEVVDLQKELAALRDIKCNSSVPSNNVYGDNAKRDSSSQELLPQQHEESAGPMFEESAIESAVTPNRTLRTTIYKRLEKTTKLSDTPETTKLNNSRCAQQ